MIAEKNHPTIMLKLVFIFLIGITYAAQTRIKIGSKSWGYQVDLNQGNHLRNEFSNDDGVTTGFYLFTAPDNQTKKLEYTINPHSMEPDIQFNVVNINSDDHNLNGSTNLISNCPNNFSISNMTFDSVDSNQDFKGHVTLKVGNASYSISFTTGDKSNSREEVLTGNGLLYGRYNFMSRNSPNKIAINYKFNSTSPDPTFEVSLFKSSGDGIERDHHRDRDIVNSISYPPSAGYRNLPYYRPYTSVAAGGGPSASSSSSSSPSSSSPAAAVPATASAGVHPSSHHNLSRAHHQAAIAEKYRSQTGYPPNWYHHHYNRMNKSYEP